MIDQTTAIEIARKRAALNGWGFDEPLLVVHRRGWFRQRDRYEIETNAGKRGSKARFIVDTETGGILSEGYVPR